MAVLHDNTNNIQELLNKITDLPTDRYRDGLTEGYANGHADGLAARTYEIWEFTLTDGSVIEKEVALL